MDGGCRRGYTVGVGAGEVPWILVLSAATKNGLLCGSLVVGQVELLDAFLVSFRRYGLLTYL